MTKVWNSISASRYVTAKSTPQIFVYSNKITTLERLRKTQKIPSFPNCDNYGICRASNPNPLNDDTRTNDNELHQQLCGTFKIDYLQEMDIITKVKDRLECKINITLPALLPNKIPGYSRGPVTSSDETRQDKLHSRNKRAMPLLAIAHGTTAIGRCC